jgi:hypothetical protein
VGAVKDDRRSYVKSRLPELAAERCAFADHEIDRRLDDARQALVELLTGVAEPEIHGLQALVSYLDDLESRRWRRNIHLAEEEYAARSEPGRADDD